MSLDFEKKILKYMLSLDHGKLEVIALHKPDLSKREVKLLMDKGYCDKMKSTLFKLTTHRGIASEETMLIKLNIDVSYETTGYDMEETSKYILILTKNHQGKPLCNNTSTKNFEKSRKISKNS